MGLNVSFLYPPSTGNAPLSRLLIQMKVMFIYAGFENIGIEYLSAVLKQAGHKTKLAFDPRLFDGQFMSIKWLRKFFSYEKQLIQDVASYNPDLIAFSVVSSDYRWALRIAAKIKEKSNVPVVFGGIHPTSAPETVIKNECVDYVILGEGEYPLLELANKLETGKDTGKIRNVWCKKNGRIIRNPLRHLTGNLDELPFPDKELFYRVIPGYRKGYTIITRRGCVNKCSYCHNSVLKKLYPNEPCMRFRSVANVIEELKFAKNRYGIKKIRINDDLFSHNEEWLQEFSKEYKKEVGLPVYCFVSPETTNEKVVRCLKEMNCYQVCMGVQSVNEKVRKDILHRKSTNVEITKAISLYRKYRIRCVVDNIIGLPGETEKDLLDMVRFYNENRVWGRIAVFWLIYFPSTDIVNIGVNKKILTKAQIKEIEERPYFTANTVRSSIHDREKSRYNLLLFMINILPKGVINFIIEKKLYKHFPIMNTALLEVPFTMFSKDRYDILRQRYYSQYLHYLPKIIKSKLK